MVSHMPAYRTIKSIDLPRQNILPSHDLPRDIVDEQVRVRETTRARGNYYHCFVVRDEMTKNVICPCGSNESRKTCCGPYLDGTSQPQTATRCMRSRYSAYVEHNSDYLLQSWHPLSRPKIVEFDPSTVWLGLSVKRSENGRTKDSKGVVEFTARYRVHGMVSRLHEISQFKSENGRWYYLSGRPGGSQTNPQHSDG